uniref:Uncharacterized protein n=1 Tax=Lactuca sativa TaxID=4236 RepID=A0A9R1WA41_LACSA|nr:hypothetical protein LSAT_V11C200055090 [Lactuca sativa]
MAIMCSSKEPPEKTWLTSKAFELLKIGSTTIIVEAPKMLKTTASLPCLRVNSGLVKANDVEIDPSVTTRMGEIDIVKMSGDINSALVLNITVHVSGRSLTIILQLVKVSHTSHTIISAIETIEIFEIVRVETNTSIDEVKALQKLKSSFQLE